MGAAAARADVGGERGDPIRIVLALREPLVESGVRAAVADAEDCVVVGSTTDAAQLPELLESVGGAVVLLDAGLVHADRSLLDALTGEFPCCRFVVMVNHTEDECILRAEGLGNPDFQFTRETLEHMGECCLMALRSGGRGCVPRSASLPRLLEAIRTVAAGEIAAGPWLSAEWVRVAGARTRQARSASITPREMEVIALVGQGLGNKQIAARLSIQKQTVKNHLSRIMTKLGVENRVELALFARTRNLV